MNTWRFSLKHDAYITLAALLTCAAALVSSCKRSQDTFPFFLPPPDGEKYTFTLPAASPYTIGSTEAEPGTLYYIDTGDPGDTVYLAGDLPVIITVPHGGAAAPDDIPDRATDCESSISTGNDANTIDLACDIVEAIMNMTHGKYPHVIINNLSRSKIDQNRGWGEDCNPVDGRGGQAWTDFHERFTGSVAIGAVLDRFGTGLYIDLHGKPNSGSPDYSLYWESVMIGYNLYGSVLSNSDDTLNVPANGYIEKSSLRFLSAYTSSRIDFAELLRGKVYQHESFGSLLQKGLNAINRKYDKDYSVVPSAYLKAPTLLYLSGEYNIQAFCGVKDGSMDNMYGYTGSRFISGFQLEVCHDIRDGDPPALRKDFARKVAYAIRKYLARHYHISI
jgi:hypothetical protein